MSDGASGGQSFSGVWNEYQSTVMTGEPEQPAPLPPSASSEDAIQPALSAESVREQVNKITASKAFVRSKHLCRFLNFTTGQVLCDQATELKEYVIGITVFHRGESFDPSIDPIVRVQARRLRQKLFQYYGTDGRNDRVLIEMPAGGYVPVFRERAEFTTPSVRLEVDTPRENNEVHDGTTGATASEAPAGATPTFGADSNGSASSRYVEALKLCRTALSLSRQSAPAGIEQSIRCYERALEIDPNCTPAYAALTVMHMMKALLDQHAGSERSNRV